jgi:hypothetical protein
MAGLALFDTAIGIFIAKRMSGDGGFMSNGVTQFAVGLAGVKAVIAGSFAVFIWRGQSWSRIAYAVLTGLSLAMSWYAIAHLALLMPVLQAVSLVLLFVPASDRWFARQAVMTAATVAVMPPDIVAPASLPQRPAIRPATLKCALAAMFLVLGLEFCCAYKVIAAWVATWPEDDSALAYMLGLIPIGLVILGYIVMTIVLAVLIWNGHGSARFVYGAMTALGLRLLLGVLSVSPALALILYAACLACFTLLFVPQSNRWLKARRA